MHKSLLFCKILIGLLVLITDGYAGDSQLAYVPGELVVRLINDYPIDSINAQFGTVDVQHLPQLDVYQLNTSGSGNLDSLAADIAAHPDVEFCHPNYVVDPLEPVQGSLPFGDATGEGEYMNQGAAMWLGLPDAHDIATGSGTVVAVIDGGINLIHPAFNGQVESGWDYVSDDAIAMDEPGGDNSGHGTFVAGLVHLVAPDATIRAYRVTNLSGESNGYIVAEAILQAVADGCRVINLSLIMMGEHHAIAAAVDYARNNDVFVVCAAGNGMSDEARYPASDTNVVAVAAVDSTWELADFSSWGDYVDVCAPGVNVYAPYLDTGYAWWGGTSFAAPFVTALGALIVSTDPNVTWTEIRQSILSTAIPLDSINSDYEGLMGAGLIDPLAALLAITGEASTIHVPADYPTIQEAIDAAYQGDTVLVAPGTYFGYLNIYSKAIKLISAEGPEKTIIRHLRIAHRSGRHLLYASGTFLPGLEVRGFTFTRGGHEGYSVMRVSASQMVVQDCIFTSNMEQSDLEDNIPVMWIYADGVVVKNCLFYDNRGGPAIELEIEANNFSLLGCTIDRCDGGGLILTAGVTGLYVRNTSITRCSNGPGIYALANADVDYNNVLGNSPNYSGSVVPGPGSLTEVPHYLDSTIGDYRVFEDALTVDAGDPNEIYNDADGTTADIGFYSGQAQPAPMGSNVELTPTTDPGVVTSLTPDFQWEFQAVVPSSQIEFAVQIGTDNDWSSAEMWDHSEVSSSEFVTYAGAGLSDFTLYYGRIRLADQYGWGAWREFEFATSVGTIVNVPIDFPTIGEAVTVASDGDTVMVEPGNYSESMIPFSGRSLILQSSGGAEVTTIQSSSSNQPFIFLDRFEEIGTTVRGLTIEGGAIGIAAYGGASVHVDSCILTGASFSALLVEDSATFSLTDSHVEDNLRAMRAWASDVSLVGNTITNNSGSGDYGGMVYIMNCSYFEMRRNIVSRGVGTSGMMIWLTPGDIVNNTFVDNGTFGLYLSHPQSMNVRNNIFAFNSGYGLRLIYDSDIPSEVMYNNAYNNYPQDFSNNEGFIFDTTNFSTDPIFTDTSISDYSLMAGSPCIDAGDPDPVYNDPDGSRNDIGALWRSLVYPAGSPIQVSPLDTANMVSTTIPDISWVYLDTAATTQQQYHLQVGSDDDWSVAEMWDTGPVSSSATAVMYAGASLNPVGKYYLRLMIHNGATWGEWTYGTCMIKTGQLIMVPDWVSDLREGIKIANNGDTVLVGPMHYIGKFTISDKNIVLKSLDGPEVTILEGGSHDYETIEFSGGRDTTMVLDGFTLINHVYEAIEIRSESSPKIVNNIIRDCNGTAIDVWGGAAIIRGNLFQRVPAPIDMIGFNGIFEDNIIIDCGGEENGWTSHMFYCSSCSNMIIRNNVFARNELAEWGGHMIVLSYGDSILIEGNTIVANRAPIGTSYVRASIYDNTYNSHVVNNIIAFNENLYGVVGRNWSVIQPGLTEYNDVFGNSLGNYDSIVPGDGSISTDPLFVDTANGDYSLMSGSPCIDAGHPGFEYWDPNGSRADMGAIPYDGPVNLPVAQSIGVVLGDLTHVILPDPVFHWHFYDEGGSPSGYEIEIGTDLDWTVAEIWQSGQVTSTDTSVVYAGPSMLEVKVYALRLRLSNGSSWGDWRMGLFTTNGTPSTPVTIFPADGDTVATIVNLTIMPSTDGNGDYLYYDFEVYADAALTQLDTAIIGIPGDSDTLGSGPVTLIEKNPFWWRSRAYDGYEYSGWSPTHELYTMPVVGFEEFHFGDLDASTIECGAQSEIVFRVSNPYEGNVNMMTNGFRVYSSADNAVTIENVSWYNPNFEWETMFRGLLLSEIYANDPANEDTVEFAALDFYYDHGMPEGASDISWKIGLSVGCDFENHLVCIDSINNRNGSLVWVWGFQGNLVYPPWDGPYCFTVEQCCDGLRGDINGDGTDSDITDLIHLVEYMFQGGADPACYSEANVNGDAEYRIDIGDLVYMVQYMFSGGMPPEVCGVTHAPMAKIQIGEPVEIAAVYDNDTTTIVMESPISLAGLELELKGEGEFRPIRSVDQDIELFHGQVGEVIKLGLLDIEAQTHLAAGTTKLLRFPGKFEIVRAIAADTDARVVYPQIVERIGQPPVPMKFQLAQNYPNPFNPSTRIAFALPQATHIELDVYNLLGQRVIRLKNQAMAAGWHEVVWNGKNNAGDMVASGIYFYRLHSNEFTESRKMLLLK